MEREPTNQRGVGERWWRIAGARCVVARGGRDSGLTTPGYSIVVGDGGSRETAPVPVPWHLVLTAAERVETPPLYSCRRRNVVGTITGCSFGDTYRAGGGHVDTTYVLPTIRMVHSRPLGDVSVFPSLRLVLLAESSRFFFSLSPSLLAFPRSAHL